MNTLWSYLNPNHWSIRSKLSATILFVVLAPTLLTLILINIGSQARDAAAVENYLLNYSRSELAQIEASLDRARTSLSGLSSDITYRRTVVTALENAQDRVTRQELLNLLDNRLIQSGYFVNVHLADLEGNIVASTQRNLASATGVNLAESFGFMAGQDAALLNDENRDVLYRDLQGNPVYGITQVVYYSDQSPAGFLIGSLNVEQVLSSFLGITNDFIPIVRYLTTSDGLILASAEAQALADTSRQRPGLISSLALREGVYTDVVGDDLYTHYVSPVDASRLLLVVENYEEVEIIAPVQSFLESNGPIYIILLTLITGGFVWLLYNNVLLPLLSIRDAMLHLGEGDFAAQVIGVERRDEIGTLARGVVSVREQVLQTIEDLEQRLADRVRDLQATQEVSRYAATQRDLQRLMSDVVNLVVHSFSNIYHAQIFLIDTDGRYAVLRASTGEAGEKLLRRGHRLAVGSTSVIGLVTGEGRVIVERDTATSSVHRANEFLPETRSELAIPLRVGSTIIGALDVQSKQDNTFFEDQVTLLQIMADQLAISVDNARLYQESLSQLERLNRTSQAQTYQGWREHMRNQRQDQLTVRTGQVALKTEALQQRALQNGETTIGELTPHGTIPVVVPIRLRGQILGVVEWELPSIDYSYDKLLLAEELVDRLAISLDNARLFEESQRTVERERVVNTITAKFSTQTDIDQILQIAVREVGQVLHVPEVNIRLTLGGDDLLPMNDPHLSAGLSSAWDLPDTPDASSLPANAPTNAAANAATNAAANTAINGNSINGHYHHSTPEEHPDHDSLDDDGIDSTSSANSPRPVER